VEVTPVGLMEVEEERERQQLVGSGFGRRKGSPLTTTPPFRTASARSRWVLTRKEWKRTLQLGFGVVLPDVFNRILLGIWVRGHPWHIPKYCVLLRNLPV
jgi:hypothetical protein